MELESLVVIPARYESSRFPGKPLAQINGKPMIQWVFEACANSRADHVVVATDDERIFNAVSSFNGNAVMTSPHHQNGTERCAEALDILEQNGYEFDVVINVQGDEPTLPSSLIDQLLEAFEHDEHAEIITAVRLSDNQANFNDPNVVKATCTLKEDGIMDALYFSRSAIPHQITEPVKFFQHIGVYGFHTEVLEAVVNLPVSALEVNERLEQLRWLQNHFVIQCIESNFVSSGVDSQEDIAVVENILK